MNEQKQIEACARLDGLELFRSVTYFPTETTVDVMKVANKLPTYDTYDDIHRLINGLSIERCGIILSEAEVFARWLVYVVTGRTSESQWIDYNFVYSISVATPAQLREALLKAKELWEEE
jgi:hypothetical protein